MKKNIKFLVAFALAFISIIGCGDKRSDRKQIGLLLGQLSNIKDKDPEEYFDKNYSKLANPVEISNFNGDNLGKVNLSTSSSVSSGSFDSNILGPISMAPLTIARRDQTAPSNRENFREYNYGKPLRPEVVFTADITQAMVIPHPRYQPNETGLLVDIIAISNEIAGGEVEYNINISWKSNRNIFITSVFLRFNQSLARTEFASIEDGYGFLKTVDICQDYGGKLYNESNIILPVIHKDRSRNVDLRIIATTNTGEIIYEDLILPKYDPAAVENENH